MHSFSPAFALFEATTFVVFIQFALRRILKKASCHQLSLKTNCPKLGAMYINAFLVSVGFKKSQKSVSFFEVKTVSLKAKIGPSIDGGWHTIAE